MLPESGFVVTELKNELRRHTGNKQATSLLQESKQLPGQIHTHTHTHTHIHTLIYWGGRRKSPLLYCSLEVFISERQEYQRGIWISVLFSIGLAQFIYISPHLIGTLELGILPEFYGPFALLSPGLKSRHSLYSFANSQMYRSGVNGHPDVK